MWRMHGLKCLLLACIGCVAFLPPSDGGLVACSRASSRWRCAAALRLF